MLLQNNLKGAQHLGIPVTDLEKSRAFYGRFGFKKVMEAGISADGEKIKVAMLEKDRFILELYQLTGSDLVKIRERSDGHIDHIALDVMEINKAFDEIRNAGLKPLEDKPVFLPFWEKGVKFFNIRGPDGEKIEFSERLK